MSSAACPQTEHADEPTNQSAALCSSDGSVSGPEVIYDDVPAETLQRAVEGLKLHPLQVVETVHGN